jgi:hypothetical protein
MKTARSLCGLTAFLLLLMGCFPPAPVTSVQEELNFVVRNTAPTSPPQQGAWIRMDIYTIDGITPEGDISVVLSLVGHTDSTFAMTETGPGVDGTSLHQLWFNFISEPATPPEYSFVDATGRPSADFCDLPDVASYRSIGITSDIWDEDPALDLYAIKDIVRNWEGTGSIDPITLTGTIKDDGAAQLDARISVSYMHHEGPGGGTGAFYLSDSPVTSNFTLPLPLHVCAEENLLPFQDTIDLSFKKNFYLSSVGSSVSMNHTTDPINAVLAANRIVTFDYAVSATSVFIGTENVTNGKKVNSIYDTSFVSTAVASAFHASFGDSRLGADLCRYDFDGDGTMDDITFDMEADGTPMAYGDIYSLGSAAFPFAVDLDSRTTSYNPDIVDENVYAIQTSNGGYVQFKITDIHVMTPGEMAAFE